MKIKICGLTKPQEAAYLNEVHAAYAGFVFYEKSKRNITIQRAREIVQQLDPGIQRVAVMVSPDEQMIEQLEEAQLFDILQIHGTLSAQVLKKASLPIWYAVNVADEEEIARQEAVLAQFGEAADAIRAIVVDGAKYGGGKVFNWRKSRRLLKAGAQSPPDMGLFAGGREFVLAGGLQAENVAEGILLFAPDVVDVSSGVEGPDGKDREKILAFAKAAEATERA